MFPPDKCSPGQNCPDMCQPGHFVPGQVGLHRRILVMGGSKVGKSNLIAKLLQQKIPKSQSNFQEMHQTMIRNDKKDFILNIEEISGTFASDFPVMFELSVSAADAVIMIYAVDDWESFEQVAAMREKVVKVGADIPIVVVGNKTDLERKDNERILAELVVTCDWEQRYVECSAKQDRGVDQVIQELIQLTRTRQSKEKRGAENCSVHPSQNRRHTLALGQKNMGKGMIWMGRKVRRRTSISSALKRDSCIIT